MKIIKQIGDQVSQMNSLITLEYLKNSPESQYFERKSIEVKPTKIANEIIGMLNADGGVLVLGISDDGTKFDDLKSLGEGKLNKYRNLIYDFIKPPANVEIEGVELLTGELIFIYHVGYEHERVFSRNDPKNENIFLRMADENKGPLKIDQIRKLEYDRGIRSFENEIEENFNPMDIRQKVVDFYRNKINFKGDNLELLMTRNLVEKKNGIIKYRKSAILLFAEDPDKYISNSKLRYIRYNGNKQNVGVDYNAIKDKTFYGGIPRLIELVKRFVSTSLNDYYFLDMSTGMFKKVSEYPEEAWLEGIVNSLTHRSYNIQGNPIYIKHFDDRIEISNSGPLPAQVNIKNIKTSRYSRNPRIARVLSEMGYVRELNEGVNRIYQSMEKSMLSEPEYIDKDNIVTLILRNSIANNKKTIPSIVIDKISSDWKKFNSTQRKIVQYLFVNGYGTVSLISKKINIAERTVKNYLNILKKEKIVKRLSNKKRDKNAKYTFEDN